MKVFILGICGTFMGGVAALAREAGHQVAGCDANVYPPMSTQLEALGITLAEGYDPAHLQAAPPDVVIVGNTVSRGNPALEYVLDAGLRYTSGPQWLAEHILHGRQVLAVAGTHGKTTTSSMLAWILEAAGFNPGFLIGGVPGNFGISARAGEGECFVVEADEYDTAFFDKRSKFVHYRPTVAVLNNLEFDHADIFDDLAAIERQFHHLLRTIPSQGLVLSHAQDSNLERVLEQGCWSEIQHFAGGDWSAELLSADGSAFKVSGPDGSAEVKWGQLGQHSVDNALAAIAAAVRVGVSLEDACTGLGRFENVKRRMELRGDIAGVRVYDDFAHHPTAISTTLAGLRANVGDARILAVLEPRSNSMRMGVHANGLADSLMGADQVWVLEPPKLDWDLSQTLSPLGDRLRLHQNFDSLLDGLSAEMQTGDHVLVMSNGGFGGLHQCLVDQLTTR